MRSANEAEPFASRDRVAQIPTGSGGFAHFDLVSSPDRRLICAGRAFGAVGSNGTVKLQGKIETLRTLLSASLYCGSFEICEEMYANQGECARTSMEASLAEKHPYTSAPGHIAATIAQLRKAFPSVVNADTLKKFEIAPNNETYVLSILKFLKIIDADGKKNTSVAPLFHKNDDEFEPGLAKLIREAYAQVFDTYGEDAWDTPTSKLVAFFRTHDDTSEVVGTRQAATFRALAKFTGKISSSNDSAVPKPKVATKAKPANKKAAAPAAPASFSFAPAAGNGQQPKGMALTVRVEINLPPGGDQATYDAIFKSIRENLLNGDGT